MAERVEATRAVTNTLLARRPEQSSWRSAAPGAGIRPKCGGRMGVVDLLCRCSVGFDSPPSCSVGAEGRRVLPPTGSARGWSSRCTPHGRTLGVSATQRAHSVPPCVLVDLRLVFRWNRSLRIRSSSCVGGVYEPPSRARASRRPPTHLRTQWLPARRPVAALPLPALRATHPPTLLPHSHAKREVKPVFIRCRTHPRSNSDFRSGNGGLQIATPASGDAPSVVSVHISLVELCQQLGMQL